MRRGRLIKFSKVPGISSKELEYREEKLKYKKVELMQSRIKNKSELLVG